MTGWRGCYPIGANLTVRACATMPSGSLSPWERAGVRAKRSRQKPPRPHPNPLPEGEGTRKILVEQIRRAKFAPMGCYPLSHGERGAMPCFRRERRQGCRWRFAPHRDGRDAQSPDVSGLSVVQVGQCQWCDRQCGPLGRSLRRSPS